MVVVIVGRDTQRPSNVANQSSWATTTGRIGDQSGKDLPAGNARLSQGITHSIGVENQGLSRRQ
jgi:hypothetical protein